MSTWSLEHIPAAGGASTFGSLKVWGIESFAWQRVNWGIDTLTVSVCGSAPAFSSATWSYLDKIVLWRDGVRFAQAWCTFSQANVQPHQTRTYTLQGPGWWLTQYLADYNPNVAPYYIGTYVRDAVLRAIQYGAPLALDPGLAVALMVHCPDVRASSSVLELIQRACRYAPLSAGWWDYTAETPVLHAARRGALSPLDLERSSYVSEPFSLSPRYDLQLISARMEYSWTDDDGTTRYLYNLAGTDADRMGPNRLHVPISLSSQAAALQASGAQIAETLMADLGPLCWTGTIPLHDGAARIPYIRPGTAVNLTGAGCRPEWATMAAVVQQVTYNHQLGTDTASIELGPPEHLGPQDYLETATLAREAGSSAGGQPGPYDPTDDSSTPGNPGTYDDLNGTTGGGAPIGSITAQARGGNWSLIGYPENNMGEGTATVPPPRYRRLTRSGANRTDYYQWGDTGCGSPNGYYVTLTWSGVCQYDPATGVLSGSATQTRRNADGSITESDLGCVYEVGYGEGFGPRSHTRAETAESGCYYIDGNPYGSYARTTGVGVVVLSDPDSSDAAISRLLATSPAWTTGQTAIRTTPTTGITGVYREARYRTEHTEGTGESAVTYPTLKGLTPWQRYRVTVTLESRPVDEAASATGAYAADGTRTHYIVANLDGEGGLDWQTIEPRAGYETRIASSTVEAA